MQGLATRTMLQHINRTPQPEDDLLAPEVEGPPGEPPADTHADALERSWLYRSIMWAALVAVLATSTIVQDHKRDSEAAAGLPALGTYALAGGGTRVCALDIPERCLTCRYTNAAGRETHRNTHCPALTTDGLMSMPVAVR